jgi:hypothetical protein
MGIPLIGVNLLQDAKVLTGFPCHGPSQAISLQAGQTHGRAAVSGSLGNAPLSPIDIEQIALAWAGAAERGLCGSETLQAVPEQNSEVET